MTAAHPLGDEAAFALLQIDYRGMAGSLHIQEKRQVLQAQRPTGHHQWLPLAHPQKSCRFQRPATDPQRGRAGIADEHQVPGAIHAELMVHRRRREDYVGPVAAENQALEWQIPVGGCFKVAAHFAQYRAAIFRPAEAPHEDVEACPVAFRAPGGIHQCEQLQSQRELAGIVINPLQLQRQTGQRLRSAHRPLQAPGQPAVVHLWERSAEHVEDQIRLQLAQFPVQCGKSSESIHQHTHLGRRPRAQCPQAPHARNRAQTVQHPAPHQQARRSPCLRFPGRRCFHARFHGSLRTVPQASGFVWLGMIDRQFSCFIMVAELVLDGACCSIHGGSYVIP